MKITTKKEMLNILTRFYKFINHDSVLNKFSPDTFNKIAKQHADIFYGTNKEKFDNGFFSKDEEEMIE